MMPENYILGRVFKRDYWSSFNLTLLGSCTASNDELGDKLQSVIINKSNLAAKLKKSHSELRLSEITDFEWDKFYIFEEYLSDKNISDITGIKWEGADVPDGHRRMLFIYKNKIVQYVDFKVWKFYVFFYSCGGTEQVVFTKKDDLFAVFKRCDKNGCFYAMVPERCIKGFFENDN